jgi:hypothetical protein
MAAVRPVDWVSSRPHGTKAAQIPETRLSG